MTSDVHGRSTDTLRASDLPGALVISLDFELIWGVRHDARLMVKMDERLRGTREAIPRLLDLFAEYGIAGTWATVGFVFAGSREELESHRPTVRPAYRDARLCPFQEQLGRDEKEDPFHFGASLVSRIRSYPTQEIASHTFSHLYCLEPGVSKEAIESDLRSAISIAQAKGVSLRSIVFPKNQVFDGVAPFLSNAGFRACRGPQDGAPYASGPAGEADTRLRRILRLMDSHIPLYPDSLMSWDSLHPRGSELVDVRASAFLRSLGCGMVAHEAHLSRICSSMTAAARQRKIFHLWWHPENFGLAVDENLAALRRVLEHYRRQSETAGMRSLTMQDVAGVVLSGGSRNEFASPAYSL